MAEQNDRKGPSGQQDINKSASFVWLRRLSFALLAFAVLCAVAVASAFYVLDRRGGLERVVADSLSDALPGLQTRIASLTFRFDFDRFQLVLKGQDTDLSYQGQHFSLETVRFIFGLSSLRTILPEEIIVQARAITLERQNGGWQFSDDYTWLNPIAGLIGNGSESGVGSPADNMILVQASGVGRLTLQADELTVLSAEESGGEASRFTDLYLSVWSDQNNGLTDQLNASMRLSQVTEDMRAASQISLSASLNLLSELTMFELRAQNADLTSLLKMAGRQDILSQQVISTVDAAVSGTFDGVRLSLLSGEISSAEGVMMLSTSDSRFKSDYANLTTSFDYSAEEQVLILHNLSAELSDGQSLSLAGRLTKIRSAEIGFSGTALGEDLAIPRLLEIWPEEQAAGLRRFVTKNTAGGRFKTVAVEFDGRFMRERSLLNVSRLNLSGEYANVRLSYKDEQYETVVGTLNGSVDLNVGADGEIQSASTIMSVRNGYLRVAGYAPTVRVPSVDLVLRQQGNETVLQNLFVDLEQSGRFSLSGIRRKPEQTFFSEVKLEADYLNTELFQRLWPKQLAPKTLSWMRRHIADGMFGKSQLNLSFTEQDGLPKLASVTGDVVFSDASFRLYQDMIAATGLSGLMRFADNLMTVNIEDGVIDKLAVSQAQITYGPLLPAAQDRNVQVKLNAAGSVDTILQILGHQKINQLKKLQLEDKSIDGDIEFSLNLAAVAPVGKRLKIEDISFDGSMTQANMSNLPMRHELKQATLVLSYQKGDAQISGSGLLSGVTTDFAYQTKTDGTMSLSLKTANENAVVSYLQDRFNLPVFGAMRLKVSVTGRPKDAKFKIGISADAKDTSASFAEFDWAKLPGEAASVNMQLIYEQGQLRHIEAIDINASSLQAKGRLAFDADMSLNHGFLEQVVVPGNRIDTVLLERDENGIMKLTAEGEQINLVPLRRNEGLAKGRALKFDVTSENIVLGKDIIFNGHLEGQTTSQGGGEARLQGNLIVKGDPLLNEGTIDAMFGAQGEFLSANGVIGGAEAELTYSPSDTGETILLITSMNGGRTLDGLNITDTVRGGKLRLATTFDAGSLSSYRTEIELVDFQVVEAPKAVRVFSVLSVAGLSSLVEGEGTNFSKGQAIIKADGSVFRLEKVRAVGEAVGVHLLGTYDRQTRQIDVSGDLIPLKQLSKLIGYVPFFGELLTGVDKTGIFSTQFTVKGDADDPEVGVNLFALAPGVLRDILSPDWLGGERRRILGVTE